VRWAFYNLHIFTFRFHLEINLGVEKSLEAPADMRDENSLFPSSPSHTFKNSGIRIKKNSSESNFLSWDRGKKCGLHPFQFPLEMAFPTVAQGQVNQSLVRKAMDLFNGSGSAHSFSNLRYLKPSLLKKICIFPSTSRRQWSSPKVQN